jgi:hypothetical protein
VALAKGLPAEIAATLNGANEEELAAHADRLIAWRGNVPPTTPRPDPGQGPRPSTPLAEEEAEYARNGASRNGRPALTTPSRSAKEPEMAEYLPIYRPGQVLTLKASAGITGGQLVAVSGSGTVAPRVPLPRTGSASQPSTPRRTTTSRSTPVASSR